MLGRADAGLSFDDLAPGPPAGAATSGATSEFDKGGIAARLVLAVVGTMKAGKSTTINAIVGREIMPNCNRPMTALPTLIRHVPGRVQPLLRPQKVQPLNHLDCKARQMTVYRKRSAPWPKKCLLRRSILDRRLPMHFFTPTSRPEALKVATSDLNL